MEKKPIRIAVVGVGNCASSLIQGIEFYRANSRKNPKFEPLGLMHLDIGGYKPWDIEVGAAFDIDRRKVGKTLKEALFAKPNCTKIIYPNLNDSAVIGIHGGGPGRGFRTYEGLPRRSHLPRRQ